MKDPLAQPATPHRAYNAPTVPYTDKAGLRAAAYIPSVIALLILIALLLLLAWRSEQPKEKQTANAAHVTATGP